MIEITEGYSIFIDRDGVINKRIVGDYVKSVDEFEFLPGVLDAFAILSKLFSRIFVVTNQQGIGKGLMSIEQLNDIHNFMTDSIVENGGRIDKIYFCPELKTSNSVMRKPSVGMALEARSDFPEVVFTKSIMVGDMCSDMLFGYRLGMLTAYVGNQSETTECDTFINYKFSDLLSFAKQIKKQ